MTKTTISTLAVIGGLIILAIILGTAGSLKSTPDTITPATSEQQDSQPNQPEQKTSEKIVISNTNHLKDEVVGEVTNKDTVAHSVALKATFYDAGGRITGTASGFVDELEPNTTRTFNLSMTNNITGYKKMKVEVENLY